LLELKFYGIRKLRELADTNLIPLNLNQGNHIMSEIFQKSKEEIALELFIYLTSGHVRHGIETKATSFESPYQQNGSDNNTKGEKYIEIYEKCLAAVYKNTKS